jgi:hypothetical protein
MICSIAWLAENTGQRSLHLLGGEGIASLPNLQFLSDQVIHADPHSTEYADSHRISILLSQSTKIAFHISTINLDWNSICFFSCCFMLPHTASLYWQ